MPCLCRRITSPDGDGTFASSAGPGPRRLGLHHPTHYARVRRESPAAYLKVCAMLVPKEVKLEHSTSAIKAMTDEEIEQAIEVIQTMLAAQADEAAKVIEGTAEPAAPPAPNELSPEVPLEATLAPAKRTRKPHTS